MCMSESTEKSQDLSLDHSEVMSYVGNDPTESRSLAVARGDEHSAREDTQTYVVTNELTGFTEDMPDRLRSEESGLEYNVSLLDSIARQRAKIGFSHIIPRVVCLSPGNDRLIFRFNDAVLIRVDGTGSNPVCDCGANDDGRACKHIYWLIDQVMQCFNVEDISPRPWLDVPGSVVGGKNLADVIKELGLERLLECKMGWLSQVSGERIDDVEEEMEEMLCVFEPRGLLQSEYRQVKPGPETPSSVYKAFSNEIAQLVCDDQWLRHRLRQIITPEFRGTSLFEKLRSQVHDAFQSLDEFVRAGPTGSDPHFDTVKCADRLSQLVEEIDRGYRERVIGLSRSINLAKVAAAALIDILRGVGQRNENCFAKASWSILKQNQPARDNNLFVRLIVEPEDRSKNFIVDVLQNIPPDVTILHQDRLIDVARKFEENGAPLRYLAALRKILPRKRRCSNEDFDEGSSTRQFHTSS